MLEVVFADLGWVFGSKGEEARNCCDVVLGWWIRRGKKAKRILRWDWRGDMSSPSEDPEMFVGLTG